MKRIAPITSTLLTAAVLGSTLGAGPAHGHGHGRPDAYRLTGDLVSATNPAGSKFEGIGADERRGVFYVSEVTGGEIHRGRVGARATTEWLAGDGTDGRFTARGITVDRAGRVYVAGGPNGIGNDRPDPGSTAPTAPCSPRCAPRTDVFLNDVAIGPDGSGVLHELQRRPGVPGRGRPVRVAGDPASGREQDHRARGGLQPRRHRAHRRPQGLRGRPGQHLVASGASRRGPARSRGSTPATPTWSTPTVWSARAASAHGGAQLQPDGGDAAPGPRRPPRRARPPARRARPDRVLTTAKVLRGRILYVDSKFDEAVASGPYEVVTDPTR